MKFLFKVMEPTTSKCCFKNFAGQPEKHQQPRIAI